jgi:histidinol-phosphate/aromatic aminotransferase/cobyric acid decarboxylase-like protein
MIGKFTDISPPVHGGSPVEEGALDFSYSVNPFPLPEAVYSAYKSAFNDISRYPDTEAAELREALASLYGYKSSSLLVTNGSAEAFSLIASALLSDGGRSVVIKPGYSDYEHVSRLYGDGAAVIKLEPGDGFEPDYKKIRNQTAAVKPRIIWICSPHNPTGIVFKTKEIVKTAVAAGGYGGWVVVDEAYSSFLPEK